MFFFQGTTCAVLNQWYLLDLTFIILQAKPRSKTIVAFSYLKCFKFIWYERTQNIRKYVRQGNLAKNNYLEGYGEIYERYFSFIEKGFEKWICLRNFSWFCAHSEFSSLEYSSQEKVKEEIKYILCRVSLNIVIL